jgi:hypothetical protein
MEKSSHIAWKIVPLRHFFPLKVVPLIEVLLHHNMLQSSFNKRETENTSEAPAHRISR